MSEHWEKIIESEIDFFLNIQAYEDRLLDRLYKSQCIRYSVTVFDEEEGQVYRPRYDTEEQAIYRIEMRETIESLLKRAIKRIQRLLRAINQLDEQEQDVFWTFCIDRDYPSPPLLRSFGYQSKREFLEHKNEILKKIYSIYEKEREKTQKELKEKTKTELKNRAYCYKQNQSII